MSEPTLPVLFANLQGQQPASLIDQNFVFLLGLIVGLNAAALPFDDTIGLGADNVQDAIVKLYDLIQGGGGGSNGALDFSNPDNSGLIGH
jgi:hypothetical protein